MSARETRMLRRALKGFVATLIAQLVVFLQAGAAPTWGNVWLFLLMPSLVAFLLALEKGLQREMEPKSPASEVVDHG